MTPHTHIDYNRPTEPSHPDSPLSLRSEGRCIVQTFSKPVLRTINRHNNSPDKLREINPSFKNWFNRFKSRRVGGELLVR